MTIWIFISISFFFKLIITKSLNETNFLYQHNEEDDSSRFDICIANLFKSESSSEEKLKNVTCILDITKRNPQITYKKLNNSKPLILYFLKKTLEKNDMEYLNDFLDEIFDDKSTFFYDLFNFIEKNPIFIDCIYPLVNSTLVDNKQQINLAKILNKILNIEGIDKVAIHFINSTHNDVIFTLLEKLYFPGTSYFKLYEYLKEFFLEYKDKLIVLLYNIFKYHEDKEKLINYTEAFLMENVDSNLTKDLRNIVRRKEVREEFINSIKFTSDGANIVKEELLRSEAIVDGIFDLINNEKIIEIIANIFWHKGNDTYILYNVPEMIKTICDVNKDYIQFLLDVSEKILRRFISQESINYFITEKFTEKLNDQYFDVEFKKYNISWPCYRAMQHIYFENYDKLNITGEKAKTILTEIRFFFLKKAIIDSTKDKNDFLTYENCLEKKFDEEKLKQLNFDFSLQPIYILAMFDDKKNKTNLSDTIFVEEYNYWFAYCLPYVVKNDSNLTSLCSQEDYNNILRVFLDFPFNMENAEVESFNITEKGFKANEKFYCALNFIIMFIPLIIQIFLLIYYSMFSKRYKKGEIINKLTINEEKDMKQNKYLVHHQQKSNVNNIKINLPKWYKFLNEYFNLIKNGAELFTNNSKESNINNINGITYIKGLLGISMILYIFGHTFLILFNLPFKNFSLSDFNSSTRNLFYFIPFISLRYSPRIILSCSGYTLIYKFLNFIDEQPRNYLLKFILRQSYKYLLLIIVVLYMRYSVYYLNIIFDHIKKPMMEILKYNLESNNPKYFINFFDCLLGYFGDPTFKTKQNIIQYFYVPLNEIFLFLFGVIFISIGYKYKFRNDMIIIIIISLIFVGKIFIYAFYVIKSNKYSTLYFNLYDYGAIMLNPIFNLPSFLIGMFFGLINYSIQKGINLNTSDSYQKIFTFEKREQAISNFEIDENDENNDIYEKNENEPNYKQELMHRKITMNSSIYPRPTELNNLNNSKNVYESQDDKLKIYRLTFKKDANKMDKNLSNNKDLEKNFTVESNFLGNTMTFSSNSDYNERIKEMPFLSLPIKFLNFHKLNEGKFYFVLIIIFFILLIILFSCAQFFYVWIFATLDKENDDRKDIMEKLSFKKIIISPSLNFIYIIDIDIVVFMINWGFFILYSKGYKIADIYDFLDNNFWSFFLKCYYSFIILSTPIILCIIYQSETLIKFDLINVILFSFINLVFIIIYVIIFYSMYEIPLKKIFKSFLVKEDILSDNADDDSILLD